MFHGQPKVEYAACTILNRWVTMTISNSSKHVVRALAGTLLAFSTAALLGACVVAAPPQRVYVEPPPPAPAEQPAYSEPAPPQDSMQASEPPPPLPDYEQPPCPADGYLWTPGYWAWGGGGGYYWVPGTWVQPPRVGVLWTPGYWGFRGWGLCLSSRLLGSARRLLRRRELRIRIWRRGLRTAVVGPAIGLPTIARSTT